MYDALFARCHTLLMASPDFITLVVGVTADGKSTLLNALMDDVRADEDIDRAEMLDMGSDNAKGTTTETQFFETNQMIGSCNLVLVDTPGFGTQKVSIEQTIASILSQFDGEVKINCIVVTAPATTTNPGLGAQATQPRSPFGTPSYLPARALKSVHLAPPTILSLSPHLGRLCASSSNRASPATMTVRGITWSWLALKLTARTLPRSAAFARRS